MYKDLERDVINAGKCVFCGTCISACPEGVLALDKWGKRVVSTGRCRMDCNVCYEMCLGVNPIEVNQNEIFGDFQEVVQVRSLMNEAKDYSYFKFQPISKSLGTIAKPKSGVVSTILIHLLEQHLIDCAVVAGAGRMSLGDPHPLLRLPNSKSSMLVERSLSNAQRTLYSSMP